MNNKLSKFFYEHDLRKLWRNWKFLRFKKILYLSHLLSAVEKRMFLAVFFIALLAGGSMLTRVYLRITVEKPRVGKTYTEGILKEPRAINPIYASADPDRDLARLIFSRLLTYSGDGKIIPDLAENYRISQDGKIYTLKIREGIRWHDGEELTAEDVIFTVKTIQDPQYKSPLRINWQGVEAAADGRYGVKFTLRSPYAPFVENLTLGIIPRHLWKDVSPDQALLHELNIKPVGSGPYQYLGIQQEKDGSISKYELKRNSDYYREGPYLKKIIFVFFKSEEEIFSAWQRGRIDGFGPFPAARAKELTREKTTLLKIAMPRLFGIFFNEKKAVLLSDQKVREAIVRAINKEEIVSSVALSGAAEARSILPPGSLGYTSDVASYPYNPEKSRELLEEAGWRDKDGDGVREKSVSQKGKTETPPLRLALTTSDWPDFLKAADIIQKSLKEAGIKITIEKYPFAELESAVIRPRNFELLLFGQVYGYEPDPFAFWHSSQIKDPGLNVALYASKTADRLLEEARRGADVAERAKKHQELQKIIAKDLPAYFLYSQLYLYAVPDDLKGFAISKVSLPADRFNEANKWYRKTGRGFR